MNRLDRLHFFGSIFHSVDAPFENTPSRGLVHTQEAPDLIDVKRLEQSYLETILEEICDAFRKIFLDYYLLKFLWNFIVGDSGFL